MLFYKVAFCFLLLSVIYDVRAQRSETVEMKQVKLSFTLDGEGRPVYQVWYGDKPVILPSALGFSLNEDSLFYRGFQWAGTERRSVDETWQPVWGEVREIRDHYEQLVVHLRKTEAPYRLLDIVFRVFEDGVG